LAIKAAPPGLHGDVTSIVCELLDELAKEPVAEGTRRREALLAAIACHSAARRGDLLDDSEVRSLLLEMDAIDIRSPGRHGRPLFLRSSVDELPRRLGR